MAERPHRHFDLVIVIGYRKDKTFWGTKRNPLAAGASRLSAPCCEHLLKPFLLNRDLWPMIPPGRPSPQIVLADIFSLNLLGGRLQGHPSIGDDIDELRDGQRKGGVLLDQENGCL
jgi:hypothetical protein